MLVVVVSQVISQRKWDWFAGSHNRPLSNLQQFDSGSRGSMGALNLLPTVVFKDTITFMAALILFASFLVGPAVQQASRTVGCTIVAPGLKASLPFAHYVPRWKGFVDPPGGGQEGRPALDLTATIISAVTVPDGLENQIRGSCSTGNCTFPEGDPINTEDGYTMGSDITTHSTVGMCSMCADLTSLVSRNRTGLTGYCDTLVLPNNFSIMQCAGGSDNVMIRPSDDLSWMGAVLSPELRASSRWAHVNATFLTIARDDSVTAAMCSLYPCVRTFTSSINNSDVMETQLRSSVMQIDMGQVSLDSYQMKEALQYSGGGNRYNRYTAVQSPCQVDGKVYDLTKNMSSYENGTELTLYDFTDYGDFEPSRLSFRNVTAPEPCIYRQHPQFAMAIANVFNNEIFNGTCGSYKGPNCHKAHDGEYKWEGYTADLGATTVLETLYSNGYTSYSNVTKWFDKFAGTMTNRYRSDYGTATFNDSRMVELPLGENQGRAWQNTTCVSMRRGWLLIPIILTAVTSILAIWTIATNWRQRHSRPVWKDNILPLLFYSREIVNDKLDAHSHRPKDQIPQRHDAEARESNTALLETSAMEKISTSTGVNIRWLYGTDGPTANDSGETAKSTGLMKRIWRTRKREEKSSNSLLLTPYEGGRTQRAGSREQMSFDTVEPYERGTTQRGIYEDRVSLNNAEPYEGSRGDIDDTMRDSQQTR
jgi:hypothetical protein